MVIKPEGGSPMRTRTPKYGTRIRCVTDYTIGLCNGRFLRRARIKAEAAVFCKFFFIQRYVLIGKRCGGEAIPRIFSGISRPGFENTLARVPS